MSIRVQWRRGTAAQWTSANPTLAAGEAGFENDTGKFKIGDGATAWSDLEYTGSAADVAAAQAAAQAASDSADAAAGSVTEAEAARDAAQASGNIYASTAAGLAATVDGDYFSVPSADSSEYLILYRRDSASVATEVKRYPAADAVFKPQAAGKLNGWPDPFFRTFDLTSQEFFGRDRWYTSGAVGLSGWTRVVNPVFDGYALRRDADISNTILNGPSIYLDEIGAAEGDTITVYALFVGDGASARCPGKFDNGSQVNPVNSGGGSASVTTSADPKWLRHEQVVPAGATTFNIYPYTTTAAKTFDVVAVWAFKGGADEGPNWPVFGDSRGTFQLADHETRIAALEGESPTPEIILPPYVFGVEGRECNVYFDNLFLTAADEYLIDAASSYGKHQNERWTWTPSGALPSGTLTVAAHDRSSGEMLASAVAEIRAAAASAGSGVNRTCLFIGDSLIAAGTITQTLLDNADDFGVTLIGTQGSGDNLQEGHSGWKTEDFLTAGSPFYIGGAVDFPQYLSDNSLATPDWVFIHLGINDVFAKTSDAVAVTQADTSFDMLDTLIDSIQSAGAGVKVALMIPSPPSADQDAFGDDYGSVQTRWRFKRNILIWARELIERYAGQEASGIYIVPSNTALDTVNNMSRAASAPVNSRSSVTSQRQNNGVHPATEGYQQIGDAVWAFLKFYAGT